MGIEKWSHEDSNLKTDAISSHFFDMQSIFKLKECLNDHVDKLQTS